MDIPIVRLEIEGMRHTISAALSDYIGKLDTNIQTAIKEACTPERIEGIVRDAVYSTTKQVVRQAIESEIHNFYSYGEGRRLIAEKVRERLLKHESGTPLDLDDLDVKNKG